MQKCGESLQKIKSILLDTKLMTQEINCVRWLWENFDTIHKTQLLTTRPCRKTLQMLSFWEHMHLNVLVTMCDLIHLLACLNRSDVARPSL